jgi:hypothetical protein
MGDDGEPASEGASVGGGNTSTRSGSNEDKPYKKKSTSSDEADEFLK